MARLVCALVALALAAAVPASASRPLTSTECECSGSCGATPLFGGPAWCRVDETCESAQTAPFVGAWAFCEEECAPGCPVSLLGDDMCHEECMTESCGMDGGDCASWFAGSWGPCCRGIKAREVFCGASETEELQVEERCEGSAKARPERLAKCPANARDVCGGAPADRARRMFDMGYADGYYPESSYYYADSFYMDSYYPDSYYPDSYYPESYYPDSDSSRNVVLEDETLTVAAYVEGDVNLVGYSVETFDEQAQEQFASALGEAFVVDPTMIEIVKVTDAAEGNRRRLLQEETLSVDVVFHVLAASAEEAQEMLNVMAVVLEDEEALVAMCAKHGMSDLEGVSLNCELVLVSNEEEPAITTDPSWYAVLEQNIILTACLAAVTGGVVTGALAGIAYCYISRRRQSFRVSETVNSPIFGAPVYNVYRGRPAFVGEVLPVTPPLKGKDNWNDVPVPTAPPGIYYTSLPPVVAVTSAKDAPPSYMM